MTVPHRSVHVRAFIRIAEDVKHKRLLSQLTITPTRFCMEPDVMLLTDMQILVPPSFLSAACWSAKGESARLEPQHPGTCSVPQHLASTSGYRRAYKRLELY